MSSQIAPMPASPSTPMPAGLSTSSGSTDISAFSDFSKEHGAQTAATCVSLFIILPLIFVPLGLLIANSYNHCSCGTSSENNSTESFLSNETETFHNNTEASLRGTHTLLLNESVA